MVAKHVIFLGAGASHTSGYPMAEKLRKEWLISHEHLREKVLELLRERRGKVSPSEADMVPIYQNMFDGWMQPRARALQLFREGGFGTIDEFCYHLRKTKADDVSRLKGLLRFVFGLHNPEKDFTQSDYYGFIQRLFDPEDLSSFRDDVVVLSYNYDGYLEWLLRRAYHRRKAALTTNPIPDPKIDGAITSGFGGGRAGLNELVKGDRFCMLKLHGMAAWPNPALNEAHGRLSSHCSFDEFFHPDIFRRIQCLTGEIGNTETPIVFPWEIFDEHGDIIGSKKFPLRDQPLEYTNEPFRHGGRLVTDPSLHDIFRAIWKRAREEVQSATKISFVGISMHEYLAGGLRYLFRDIKSTVNLTITDRQSVGYDKNSIATYTPLGRFTKMRERDFPGLQFRSICVRNDFADFIGKDLN